MPRRFTIEISKDYGWEIEVEDFKPPYDEYKSAKEFPVSIGVCKEANGKLIAIYDPFVPKSEAIEEAKTLEAFKELCVFTYSKESFEGTFADALIFIKEKHRENELPKLEDLK